MFLENINFENYFSHSDFQEVKDVIELIIKNSIEYKVISDFMLTKKEVYHIFNTRFEIQKFVTKSDAMKGYEDLLSNVSEISDDTVLRVVAMKTHNIFIQFFINNTNEKLLGVLWKK